MLQSDESYRCVHCLVNTNKHLHTFFIPLSLSSPSTITELLEELLEVRISQSRPQLLTVLSPLSQMEDHRNTEGDPSLHLKYTRLQYKLRNSGYSLVRRREDDLPRITKTGQTRFQPSTFCYSLWLGSYFRNKYNEIDSTMTLPLPLNNNNCLDVMILKLDKISQKIEFTLNQELFRHGRNLHLLSNYSF